MTEKKMLGNFIYELRKSRGLSQAELGYLCGVSNKAVSKWETDEANPDLSVIPKLAGALGVTADELLNCERAQEAAEAEESAAGAPAPIYLRLPQGLEYVSKRKTKNGTPFVHINFSSFKAAKGIIAIGFNAKGIISIGLFSRGVIAIGLLPIGILSLGMFAFGLLAAGSLAVGGIAAGGAAIGVIAVGGAAVGVYALGGFAAGYWAVTGEGGYAIGKHIQIIANNMFYRTGYFG